MVARTAIALAVLASALAGQAKERPAPVRFVGKARYLNNAAAVVTHTFDDSHPAVIRTLDALDKYGVKATAFVSTERKPISDLWGRLNEAIGNGHEIGSHSRRHQCKWPDTEDVCKGFYDDYEVKGSRDDILANTHQPYVWSWCYPCGNCANHEFAWKKIAEHGYIAARNYPGEQEDRHNLPDLQSWADNPFNSAYTQVVQKKGGIAKTGRTDVAELNAKFDEVLAKGGIYHFLSHPAWLDFGEDQFYEKHLAHIGRRANVWYAPFGPMYAYRTLRERADIIAEAPGRFRLSSGLDPVIYDGSVTLEFTQPKLGRGEKLVIRSDDTVLWERKSGLTDRWNDQYFRREDDRLWVTVPPRVVLTFVIRDQKIAVE